MFVNFLIYKLQNAQKAAKLDEIDEWFPVEASKVPVSDE